MLDLEIYFAQDQLSPNKPIDEIQKHTLINDNVLSGVFIDRFSDSDSVSYTQQYLTATAVNATQVCHSQRHKVKQASQISVLQKLKPKLNLVVNNWLLLCAQILKQCFHNNFFYLNLLNHFQMVV